MNTTPTRPSIYYLTPDSGVPSWGIGLLYKHVEILRNAGVQASVLHHSSGFSIHWLESRVPIAYLDDPSLEIGPDDVLVVPEVLADEGSMIGGSCRRVVFVQGSYLILKPFDEAISYRDLGYDAAVAVLPHVKEVLERHFDIEATVVPPFIAPYFFLDELSGKRARQRRILMFPKPGYREAGFLDYEIVRKLLQRACLRNPPWEFMEVMGRPHQKVASLMQDSEFLVSVNCLEAFNTTVPEAMAAGCLPICYEGFGGQDFLAENVNAFVFQNNHVYGLVDTVEKLLEGFGRDTQRLAEMRTKAYQTAVRYREPDTKRELLAFFRDFNSDRSNR